MLQTLLSPYCNLQYGALNHLTILLIIISQMPCLLYFVNNSLIINQFTHFINMDKQDQGPVKFYKKDGPYGFFSNFYPAKFEQNGIVYPTTQHYFQSKKFQGKPYELEVVKAPKPHDAFNMGQTRQVPLRQDWNQVKEKVMYRCLTLKFQQNADIKQQFLATGNREIIEHTAKDSYWGDGLGKGKNRLGILLMELRDELRKNEAK